MKFLKISGSYPYVVNALNLPANCLSDDSLEQYLDYVSKDVHRTAYYSEHPNVITLKSCSSVAEIQERLLETSHFCDEEGSKVAVASYIQGDFTAGVLAENAFALYGAECPLYVDGNSGLNKIIKVCYADEQNKLCGLAISQGIFNQQPHYFISIIKNVNSPPAERDVFCYIGSGYLEPLKVQDKGEATLEQAEVIAEVTANLDCGGLSTIIDLPRLMNDTRAFDALQERVVADRNIDNHDVRHQELNELLRLRESFQESDAVFAAVVASVRDDVATDPNYFIDENFIETVEKLGSLHENHEASRIKAQLITERIKYNFIADKLSLHKADSQLVMALTDLAQRLAVLESNLLCSKKDGFYFPKGVGHLEHQAITDEFESLILKHRKMLQNQLEPLVFYHQEQEANKENADFVQHAHAEIAKHYQRVLASLPQDKSIFFITARECFDEHAAPIRTTLASQRVARQREINDLKARLKPRLSNFTPLQRFGKTLASGLTCLVVVIGLALLLSGVFSPLGVALTGLSQFCVLAVTGGVFLMGASKAVQIVKGERAYRHEFERYVFKKHNIEGLEQENTKDEELYDVYVNSAPVNVLPQRKETPLNEVEKAPSPLLTNSPSSAFRIYRAKETHSISYDSFSRFFTPASSPSAQLDGNEEMIKTDVSRISPYRNGH